MILSTLCSKQSREASEKKSFRQISVYLLTNDNRQNGLFEKAACIDFINALVFTKFTLTFEFSLDCANTHVSTIVIKICYS